VETPKINEIDFQWNMGLSMTDKLTRLYSGEHSRASKRCSCQFSECREITVAEGFPFSVRVWRMGYPRKIFYY